MHDKFEKLLETRSRGIFFVSTELEDFTRPDDRALIVKELTRIYNEYSDRSGKYFGPEFIFEQIAEDSPIKRVRLLVQMPPQRDNGEQVIGHVVLRYEEDPQNRGIVLVMDEQQAEPTLLVDLPPEERPHQGLRAGALIEVIRAQQVALDQDQVEILHAYLDHYLGLPEERSYQFTFDLTVTKELLQLVARRNYRFFSEFSLPL